MINIVIIHYLIKYNRIVIHRLKTYYKYSY